MLVASSSLMSGEVATVGWAAAVFGVVVLALMLPRVPWVPRMLRVAVAVHAIGLSVAVIVVGIAAWMSGTGVRVELLGDNPNVVGAGVALAALAWAAVAPRRRFVWWVWPLAAVAVPALVVVGWQFGVVERVPNIVVAPKDFANRVWNTYGGAKVTVIPDAAPGPFDGTRPHRIVAQAGTASLVFLQGMGQSEPGVPYVASVYLRADEPQTIGLSSRLASTRCGVGLEWQRCVTPVGFGNGVRIRQHRFSTSGARAFDVYVYGAQYERGLEATPFVEHPIWWPQTIINRFDVRWMLGVGTGRGQLHDTVIGLWQTAPTFGLGRVGAERALAETYAGQSMVPGHAHGLPLQLLLEDGLVGVIGWTLALAAIVILVPATAWSALGSLAVAVIVANWWDTTLFTRLSLYVVVLAFGIAGAAYAARRSEGSTPAVRDAS